MRALSKIPNPLSVRLGPPFIHKGVATVAHRRWQATVVRAYRSINVGQLHLMCCLRVLSLYWGRQRRPSHPSPVLLASPRVRPMRHAAARWPTSYCVGEMIGFHEDLHAVTEVPA